MLIPKALQPLLSKRLRAHRPPPRSCTGCGVMCEPYQPGFVPGWYAPDVCLHCQEMHQVAAVQCLGTAQDSASLAARWRNAGLTPADLAAAHPMIKPLADFERAPSYGEAHRWCAYLVGACGTGKTSCALAAVKHYVLQGWACKYATMGGLLDTLKPGGADGVRRWRVSEWLELDLVVIDEFGAEGCTAWGAEQMRKVVDGRYHARRPTIICSNHGLHSIAQTKGLGEFISTRIISGIGGAAAVVTGQARYAVLSYCYRLRRPTPPPAGLMNWQALC